MGSPDPRMRKSVKPRSSMKGSFVGDEAPVPETEEEKAEREKKEL